MPLLRAAKQHEHLKKKCRLEDDKLIIKGKPYTTANLHELPEEVNVFSATTKEDNSSIAFFGAINPLSNFYEAEFTIDGTTYISSEQYIQAMKSIHFKDNVAYNLIMGSRTSLDCKTHGSKVKNYKKEEWDNKAKDLCRPGIHAKFQQNPELFRILCEKTGEKTIVESANDRVWGTGMTLGNPECLNRDRWVSQGILGELLEEVRAQQHHRAPVLREAYPLPLLLVLIQWNQLQTKCYQLLIIHNISHHCNLHQFQILHSMCLTCPTSPGHQVWHPIAVPIHTFTHILDSLEFRRSQFHHRL